jgi:hypothetical protein
MTPKQRKIIAEMGPYKIYRAKPEADEAGRLYPSVMRDVNDVGLLNFDPKPCEWDKAVVAALNEITKKENEK